MADAAISWKSRLYVIGIGGSVVVLGVTGIAIGRGPLENAIDMTCGTFQRRMNPGERKVRKFGVIELGAKPRIHGVAYGAIGGESHRAVIQRGSLKILLVTGETLGGESEVLPGGGPLVA